jgi:4-aminobutyrate aminotransferase-like enzyme
MKPTALAKHVRVLRLHAENVVVRCKSIEDVVTQGEMWGVEITDDKVNKQVRDIENRLLDAAKMIGVRYEGKQTKWGAHG